LYSRFFGLHTDLDVMKIQEKPIERIQGLIDGFFGREQ
jgi:hypothetical protein